MPASPLGTFSRNGLAFSGERLAGSGGDDFFLRGTVDANGSVGALLGKDLTVIRKHISTVLSV